MSKQVATPEQVEKIEQAITDYGNDRDTAGGFMCELPASRSVAVDEILAALGFARPEATSNTEPKPDRHRCPRCGSRSWVGYGTHPNSGPVRAQCVPCGQVYQHPAEA